MYKYIILFVIILTLLGAIFFIKKNYTQKSSIQDQNTAEKILDVEQHPQYDIQTYIIQENDTFATVLEEMGIGYSDMLNIIDAASSTYDMTRIRVGQPMRIAKDTTGIIKYLEYEIGKESYVRIVFLDDGTYQANQQQINYDTQIVRQSGVVSSSLYLDGLEAQIPEGVIIEYADIFAWTIDFSVQVQPGDSFEILYEKRSRDGKDAGYGKILSGKFVNNGKEYSAYLFKDKDDKQAYYSAEGESLQKQFLKAPLEFRRISSGYTYARFDPINHAKTAHLAIDYAAAMGTPIMAVGDGTIEFAGWSNLGFGNFISIHHNETYTTQYAHMSGFAKGIKKGVNVVQGQVIGYVGSTGHSTGPHLHYQIRKNGTLVNPLQLELPAGDPVAEDQKELFMQEVQKYEEMLKTKSTVTH